jgi:putative nucleotidyltransferase with HDIG domain
MKCPGQDTQYWKPGAIYDAKCPECGHQVEFFKDDTTRKCGHCGHRFINPQLDFGCASYCQYAEQCIGNLPPELLAEKEDLLKDRVAIEMKRYFKTDFKRIGHAMKVARYAERIGKQEGGNLAVILCAAYLHDIGIHAAESKHGDTASQHHEVEGPPIARDILERLGATAGLIDEVCDIIGRHHHPQPDEPLNFRVVYDADLITNIEEQQKDTPQDSDQLEATLAKALLTTSGPKEARAILLQA